MRKTSAAIDLVDKVIHTGPAVTSAGRDALALVSETPCARCTTAGVKHTRDVIRDALERSAFEFRVQRIVPLTQVSGCGDDYELLLRLRAGDGTLVEPAAILRGAEQAGLATVIDRYVFEVLMAWLETVSAEQAAFGRLSINLSAQSVANPEFRRYVLSRLDGAALDPRRLRFEITETAFMVNLDEARRFICEMREREVGVSLDDFGAGFASLAYLKHLPCDQIKIDAEFVRDVHLSEFDRAVVRCVAELAAITDMAIVAEGVENPAVLGTLVELGVGFGQGYHFARPAPMASLLRRDEVPDDSVTPAA